MREEKMIRINLDVPLFVHAKLVERQQRRKERGWHKKTLPEVTREAVLSDLLQEEFRKERS